MSKIQLGFYVAKGVAIDVANDVLSVWWMEVYPFRLDQSKSLLHAEIKNDKIIPTSKQIQNTSVVTLIKFYRPMV